MHAARIRAQIPDNRRVLHTCKLSDHKQPISSNSLLLPPNSVLSCPEFSFHRNLSRNKLQSTPILTHLAHTTDGADRPLVFRLILASVERTHLER